MRGMHQRDGSDWATVAYVSTPGSVGPTRRERGVRRYAQSFSLALAKIPPAGLHALLAIDRRTLGHRHPTATTSSGPRIPLSETVRGSERTKASTPTVAAVSAVTKISPPSASAATLAALCTSPPL